MKAGPYVVLRVSTSADFRDPFAGLGSLSFGPRTELMGGEVSVDKEWLSKSDLTDVRKDRGVLGFAPLFPTKLVEPTAIEETPAPLEAGNTWGVIVTRALESPYSGKGVTVAILDTGIDAEHEAFRGVQLIQEDFTGEGNGDHQGHGTHVAGTILGRSIQGFRFGVAQGVERALIGKVLDSKGRGTTDQICRAIQWAQEQGAQIINMSLGLDFPGLVEALVQEDVPLAIATSQALEAYRATLRIFDCLAALVRNYAPMYQSTLIVAAAGNESKRGIDPRLETTVAPPAAADGVVSVGALRTEGEPHRRLTVAEFSNTGPNVAAPGVAIYSAWPGNSYRKISGTSMASPHVVGIAALWAEKLLAEKRQLNLTEFGSRLVASATIDRLVPPIELFDIGAGLVQAPTG